MAQEIYHRSEWGNPTEQWGNVYLNADLTNELYKRASEYENSWVTDQLLNGVGIKPSIILTPTAYEDGVLNSVKPAKTFGSELVTNGTFDTDTDWTKLNATISDGKGNLNGDGQTSLLYQNILTNGKTYKATFTISDYNELGEARVMNNNGASIYTITSNGTFTINFTHSIANGNFLFRARTGAIFSIDNVSVKEVIDADFDFTRGSSATRVNEQGLVEDVQILSGELVQNGDFEQIGSELVTNGGFDTDSDWTLTQAQISDGTLKISTSDGSFSGARQFNTFTVGKNYLVSLEISDIVGTIEVDVNGGSNYGQNFTTNGVHSFYLYATNTDIEVKRSFGAEQVISGTIDNVSVKEVGQNWTFFGEAEFTENGARIYSSSGGQSYINQAILTNTKKYRLSYEITDSTTGSLKLINVNGLSDYPIPSTVGTHTLDFIANNNTFFIYRNSGATDVTIDNISVIEITDDTDLPRINYTDGEGSLLLEPQSTNLVTNSETYSSWNKDASVSITSTNNTSPTNESNASKITVTDSGRLYHDPSISTTADRVTSIFLKGGSFVNFKLTCIVSSEIDLSTETASNGFGIEKLSNGWFRISTTAQSVTPTSRRIQIQAYPDNTYTNGHGETGTYYLFGVQMENSILTSYIPTNGSTVTRLADVCNNSGNSDLINSTEGVLYAEISALANDGSSRTIALNKDSNDRIQMYFDTTDNVLSIFYKAQGTHIFGMSETLDDATEFNKIAFKWKTNDFALWVNGTETDTVSSGVTSNANTLNALEFEMFNDFAPFYGNVKCVAVFKEALSDTELQKLTTI